MTLMRKHFTQEISGMSSSLDQVHSFFLLTLTVGQHSNADGSSNSNHEGAVRSDETLLSLFQEHYAIHCPCVIVPPDISAKELRANNPWLYKVVLVVATSNNRNQQMEMGKKLAIDISTAMGK